MERFAVTPCIEYLSMSWGGSEKNRWFHLDVSISMLRSSSGGRSMSLEPFKGTISPYLNNAMYQPVLQLLMHCEHCIMYHK